MINTVSIKSAQLKDGFFTTGSGAEVILVMGSCRVVNFVTYLDEWNKTHDNRFTIHTLDPFNFCWNEQDERVDMEAVILACEKDTRMLNMIRSVDIFLHEFYANFGMFNVFKERDKTIYNFGMNPKIDVCIPSWNDLFVLAGDILTFDLDIRKKALQDFNVAGKLSKTTKDEIFSVSQRNINKFYDVCEKSSIPEMGLFFTDNFTKERLFWSYNHTTKWYTLAAFKMINDKFLKLDLSTGFDENHIDIFANNYTHLLETDIELYGYQWPEEVLPVAGKLFF